jgi:uncharacterized membrane protein YidH (DUF202 family)
LIRQKAGDNTNRTKNILILAGTILGSATVMCTASAGLLPTLGYLLIIVGTLTAIYGTINWRKELLMAGFVISTIGGFIAGNMLLGIFVPVVMIALLIMAN